MFYNIYINVWCVKSNETSDTRQFISIPKNKLHGLAFKVNPSQMHFPILSCTAGRIFLGYPLAPLDSLNIFKIGSFDDPLEKKKIMKQYQVNREAVPVQWCSSCPGHARYSWCCEPIHCHGEAAWICSATIPVTSHTQSEGYPRGSSCRLADWLSGPVARTYCG